MSRVRHVVMWQLNDPNTRLETIAEMAARLEPLVGVIPGLLSLKVSPSLLPEEGNWDVLLISEHESLEAFRTYQTHPDHLEVGTWVTQQVATRAAVDYEVQD